MPAVSGSPTQLKTSVLTLADLEGQPDDAYLDGDMAYVASTRATYQLDRASTATRNGSTVLSTYSDNGRWDLFASSLTWESQATWFIDSVTGSDENDGDTALTALATWAEFIRRVQTLRVSMTVNIVSAPTESIKGTFRSGAAGVELVVQGVPTVLASGSTSTFVTPNPATNARGTVTVTEIDFSLYVGKIARSGTKLLPITSNAVAVGRGGYWGDFFNTAAPANASHVEVLELPSVLTVQLFTEGFPVFVKYLHLTSTSQVVGYSTIDTGIPSYDLSTYAGWQGCRFDYYCQVSGPNTFYFACLLANATNSIVGPAAQFYGGGAIGGISNSTRPGNLFFAGFLVEGGASGTVFTSAGANVSDSGTAPLGVFTSTAAAITVQGGAIFSSGGATYGSSSPANGVGFSIATGGQVRIASGTPTITGTNADFKVDTLTALVAPPTAGGVWAAAVDLSGAGGVGWGKWVAGGRKFVNYATLSAITS